MLRTLQAAEIAGIRAFAVHAKDDVARSFYERFDFIASPSDPYHLFRLLKDIRCRAESVRQSWGQTARVRIGRDRSWVPVWSYSDTFADGLD